MTLRLTQRRPLPPFLVAILADDYDPRLEERELSEKLRCFPRTLNSDAYTGAWFDNDRASYLSETEWAQPEQILDRAMIHRSRYVMTPADRAALQAEIKAAHVEWQNQRKLAKIARKREHDQARARRARWAKEEAEWRGAARRRRVERHRRKDFEQYYEVKFLRSFRQPPEPFQVGLMCSVEETLSPEPRTYRWLQW